MFIFLLVFSLDEISPIFLYVKPITTAMIVIIPQFNRKAFIILKYVYRLNRYVINPDTDIHKILPLLKYFDLVLVMSVFPGKGGQTFIENSVEKISMLDNHRKKHNLGYQIEVDGGINKFTASICKDKGVDILVAGSYILKSENYKERIKSLL